jgi:hypothetical protein
MSRSPLHEGSGELADMAAAMGAEDEGSSTVRITVIVQNRYTLDAGRKTGKQLKEMANVPMGFVLYRRMKGGNEPISDDALIKPRNGDHFFARPLSNASSPE